ncbi:hypothetical protein SARC_06254 [Sphaeroforma arctica JP610]|uniref:GCS light chain n=1 Tax=Sphaeroforma arctica JP610 TaxID=667725 RepID=A0A0L0FZL8_9EUKA|nr:hypothetical protein SARC_06254 [Sphaeroforma arctica JP610]KNC81413.1 hypothetical protein SARC_06254 [Sphaeroforma arctica JP610]|eukprot:XP_014155315.1 hypothetical protein SARC_06254 [Sphaeroforma arctica JP610]
MAPGINNVTVMTPLRESSAKGVARSSKIVRRTTKATLHTQNFLATAGMRSFPSIVDEMTVAFQQEVAESSAKLLTPEQWSTVPVESRQMTGKLFLGGCEHFEKVAAEDVSELVQSSISNQNVHNMEVLFVSLAGSQSQVISRIELEEVWSHLSELVKQGSVKHLGVVDATIQQLEWLKHAESPPTHVDVHSKLLEDESFLDSQFFKYCKANGIVMTTHSDAKGHLTCNTDINFQKDNECLRIKPCMALRYTVSATHRATPLVRGYVVRTDVTILE